MDYVRTPEERFEDLDGYPFSPNYMDVPDLDGGDLRMHYVDEGNGEVLLCLHGQPSWSYLYRKMLPILVNAGYRVVAPDLIGFGRSDKPIERSSYTYANHIIWLLELINSLGLINITLVGQDWGGLIGLRAAVENPDVFSRIVAANTGLPDAEKITDAKISEVSDSMRRYYKSLPTPENTVQMAQAMANDDSGMGFFHWVKYCSESKGFSPEEVLSLTTGGILAPAERKAYGAPFPEEKFLAGARQFPSLVPIIPDDIAIKSNRAAWAALKIWTKPFLTAFSDSDPITAGWHTRFQNEVPGARGQSHVTIKGAGHFLQEQSPEEFSNAIINFMKNNPL